MHCCVITITLTCMCLGILRLQYQWDRSDFLKPELAAVYGSQIHAVWRPCLWLSAPGFETRLETDGLHEECLVGFEDP